jgi:hypothetical protein
MDDERHSRLVLLGAIQDNPLTQTLILINMWLLDT